MRYDAEDFNYTFVSTEEGAVVGEGTSTDVEDPLRRSSLAGDMSSKPYVYSTPQKYGGKHGATKTTVTISEGDSEGGPNFGEGGGEAMAISGLGACCCCVWKVRVSIVSLCESNAALIIAGGITLAYEKYDGSNNSNLILAGTILLISAAASFLLGCCSCCFSFVVACAPAGGGDESGPSLFGNNNEDGDNRDIKVQLRRINGRYEKAETAINKIHLNVIGDMKEVKETQKKEEKARKDEEKKKQKELEDRVKADLEAGMSTQNMRRNYRPIAFLVRFHGDMMLSSMELLRKQVSIIVNCGRAGVDRAIIVVTSPGGAVSPYGLAASQLVRIRKSGIELIVCVDTVAASGGYMMASVGDIICAAPFAIIGSIGVVTQVPNFQKFLNKNDIDAFLFTAGKHKRTIDIIGDVTEEGKQKLQEELDDMHRAFKDHVALARPALQDTIEEIGSGEYWMAVQAKKLGLVDEIMTSDEYLESLCLDMEIIEILEKKQKKSVLASALHGAAREIKSSMEGMTYSSPAHTHRYQ